MLHCVSGINSLYLFISLILVPTFFTNPIPVVPLLSPIARLSWPFCQLLSAHKCIVSYRPRFWFTDAASAGDDYVCILLTLLPDSFGKDMFSDFPSTKFIHLFIRLDRSGYHDISWMAWALSIKLIGNIHQPPVMTWLDSGGQRSRSRKAKVVKASTLPLACWSVSSSCNSRNRTPFCQLRDQHLSHWAATVECTITQWN